MDIAILDQGPTYDADTPARRPTGGTARAVIGLASALAARGHSVSVAVPEVATARIRGVRFIDIGALPKADLVCAIADPRLFARASAARQYALIVTAHPEYLKEPAHMAALKRYRPALCAVHETQARLMEASDALAALDLPVVHLPPGADPAFMGVAHPEKAMPVAVSTAHPARGLADLIGLWRERIRPQVPDAELHVYSRLLPKRLAGSAPSPEDPLAAAVAAVRGAEADGITVQAPLEPADVTGAFAAARLFVYPGDDQDFACFGLADSQVAGLPAVAFDRGGVRGLVADGETGMIAPDADAFVNLTVAFLNDAALAGRMGTAAAGRRQGWLAAAEIFERLEGLAHDHGI